MRGFRIFIGILCIAAAVGIGAFIGKEILDRQSQEAAYEELRAQELPEIKYIDGPPVREEPEEPEKPQVYIPEKAIDWENLRATNPDIYAWVYVPDTNIDYPVLQHPDDDLYYLNHNLDGSQGYPGCVYTEPTFNSKTFQDNVTVMYGHNMKNGTMFASLHNFENKEFFDGERMIYVYTPEGNYAYEVFSAFDLDDRHLLSGYSLYPAEALERYQKAIFSSANGYFKDIDIEDDTRILTLSTCATGGRNEVRYMIQGVRLN